MKDRTVSLDGRLYEADAHLVGQLVTLRYDPDAPPQRAIEVVHDGTEATWEQYGEWEAGDRKGLRRVRQVIHWPR